MKYHQLRIMVGMGVFHGIYCYMGKQFQLGISMYQQQYIMGFDWGYNGNIMWMHGI